MIVSSTYSLFPASLELEVRSQAINWWVVEGQQNQPTSRLLALWNRTDGDCLLDSLMQVNIKLDFSAPSVWCFWPFSIFVSHLNFWKYEDFVIAVQDLVALLHRL